MSSGTAREHVRVARALRDLPVIRAEFAAGRLSYAKVRALTRIATPATEAGLAELADIVGRRVQWYYRLVAPARGHGSWTEHAEMIDVIEAGEPERAQALARKHTERTRQAYHRPRPAS